MSEKIIIEYDLQEEDIKRMWRFLLWDSPDLKVRRQNTILIILLVIILVLSFIIYIDVNSFNKEFLLKFLVFFSFCTIPILIDFNNRVGINMEKKASKDLVIPENKNILGERYFEIDSDNIIVKADFANSKMLWDAITKISISDLDFYLYLDFQTAFLIPKRVFKTNEERNTFENLLRSKMPITDYRTKNPNE